MDEFESIYNKKNGGKTMEITCNIIQDILPLYAEDIASQDSKKMIEEHISSCETCRNYLNEMKTADEIPPENSKLPLKKIRTGQCMRHSTDRYLDMV
ncbi:MAG: zf-HC2 domain-containing protein [Clostridium sp.]|nr:zf-HC2 domain-containing protein [Clostridium sp.]